MKWQFNLSVGQKNVNLTAEVIFTTYQIEEIRVSGEGISIVLVNNRPLLEAIGLKQPLSWRLISGEVKDPNILNGIKKELEKHLTQPLKGNQPTVNQSTSKSHKETGKRKA